MRKIYNWMKTNKVVTSVVVATVVLIALNLVLMAQFINILNTFI